MCQYYTWQYHTWQYLTTATADGKDVTDGFADSGFWICSFRVSVAGVPGTLYGAVYVAVHCPPCLQGGTGHG